jgi:hypothetical protein
LELLKCISLVNGLKRRVNPFEGLPDGATINKTDIVMLNLAPPRKPQLIMDDRTGALIEVSGRTMVTASKANILETVLDEDTSGRIADMLATEKINSAGKYLVSTE